MTRTTVPAAPLILVTTAHPTLHQHPGPNGEAVHPFLGRLLQPRHLSSVELTAAAGIPWAADNDCFQGLNEPAYRRMLDRLEGLEGCLFVTVPDVVGDAVTTLEQFDAWAPELEQRGFPLGLVAQDGMSLEDLAERAPRLAALFIGGSTDWKEGPEAAELAIAAKAAGLWVHWGRVNTRRRFDLIVATGAADSFDGSKWARFRKTYLPGGLEWLVDAAAARDAALITRTPATVQEAARMAAHAQDTMTDERREDLRAAGWTPLGDGWVTVDVADDGGDREELLELKRRGIAPIAGGSQELTAPARLRPVRLGLLDVPIAHVTYERGGVCYPAALRRSAANPARIAVYNVDSGKCHEAGITVVEALDRWPDARASILAEVSPRDRRRLEGIRPIAGGSQDYTPTTDQERAEWAQARQDAAIDRAIERLDRRASIEEAARVVERVAVAAPAVIGGVTRTTNDDRRRARQRILNALRLGPLTATMLGEVLDRAGDLMGSIAEADVLLARRVLLVEGLIDYNPDLRQYRRTDLEDASHA